MGYYNPIKKVVFQTNLSFCININDLEKIGAGYDGLVFRYKDMVLKILKYDTNRRTQDGMMTFNKALYFMDNLDLTRITQPIDLLFDTNGIFAGYVMKYIEDISQKDKIGTPMYKELGSYTCGEYLNSAYELDCDFNSLTKNNILAQDLNPGSIIYSYNFINLCDIDKYMIIENSTKNISDLNRTSLNYVLAKVLYFTMRNIDNISKEDLKKLYKWIRTESNSQSFISRIEKDIGTDYSQPMSEYAKYKIKQIIH